MKRMRFLLCCVVSALAFFAAGCSDGGGSGAAPQNAAEFSKYSAGKIIKNKVVSLSGEDSGYWEYLKFESETTGKYYLYKDGSEVPEYARDFVYEPASGKFSAGSGESAVSSYMFDTTKDGKKVSVIAKEEMNCKAESPALCAEWNAAAVSFSFDKEMKVAVKSLSNNGNSLEFSAKYTEENGWITVETLADGIPLFYSAANRMYYLAYETERSGVDGVGRNAGENHILLTSPVFILADIQL